MNEETKNKILAIAENTKDKVCTVVTKKRLKKAAALMILASLLAAGGGYFIHQNKVQAKAEEKAAQTQLMQHIAVQNNVKLLSTDEIKSIVASTLGVDAQNLTFKSIYLDHKTSSPKLKEEKTKRLDKTNKKDKDFRNHDTQQNAVSYATEHKPISRPNANTTAAVNINGQKASPKTNPNTLQPASTTTPIHNSESYVYKVQCMQNKLQYKFSIDAETGKILKSDVKRMLVALPPMD